MVTRPGGSGKVLVGAKRTRVARRRSETGPACSLDMDVLDFADRDLEAIMAEDERTAEQIDAARPPFPRAPFGVRLARRGWPERA